MSGFLLGAEGTAVGFNTPTISQFHSQYKHHSSCRQETQVFADIRYRPRCNAPESHEGKKSWNLKFWCLHLSCYFLVSRLLNAEYFFNICCHDTILMSKASFSIFFKAGTRHEPERCCFSSGSSEAARLIQQSILHRQYQDKSELIELFLTETYVVKCLTVKSVKRG